MKNTLTKYIPHRAVDPIYELLLTHKVHLKIVSERATKHGDWSFRNGQHQITVNGSLNKYRFLITLVHEIAHLVTFKNYALQVKPHGIEWKTAFRRLMLPFINPTVFPQQLLPIIAQHFKNPKASSDTDAILSVALQKYDTTANGEFIYEIPTNCIFKTKDGRVFKKGQKKIKRYECIEINSGKVYLFQPNTRVVLIK